MMLYVLIMVYVQYLKINIIVNVWMGGKEMVVYLMWMSVSIVYVRDNLNVLILKGVIGVNVFLGGLV